MTRREIFTEIAKKFLNIETLETRNSDRLDFHDTAVWSLEAALEAAYLAGIKAAKEKPTETTGTMYMATVEISYQDLFDIFGEPQSGDQYKTQAEWTILLPKNKVLTIYNYKNSRSYSGEFPEITDVKEWHIGGRGEGVVDTFLRMMVGAKIIHRNAGV